MATGARRDILVAELEALMLSNQSCGCPLRTFMLSNQSCGCPLRTLLDEGYYSFLEGR